MAVFFGALWGIGGLTFGLSMRYLGIALGQSIALGLCAALGTLVPTFVSGPSLFADRAGILILIGVAISLTGITIIGYAGHLKTKTMSEEERKAAVKEFALKKGILIAVLAGAMSACFSFGLEAGEPIVRVELVRNGEVIDSKELSSKKVSYAFTDADDVSGLGLINSRKGERLAYYYLRVGLAGGGMAWSSPVWLVAQGEDG